MILTIQRTNLPTANGCYTVRAPGCAAAELFWANENGALENWTSFAYIPITPDGEGEFLFEGARAIPPEATHVYVKAIRSDRTAYEEALEKIPGGEVQREALPLMRFAAFSDLHLSAKPWRIRRGLKSASSADCVLLAGDMTNDGTPEQMAHFARCVGEILPDTPVFSCTGNHDIPRNPLPQVIDGICDYHTLQTSFLRKAEQSGWTVEYDRSGAYAASRGEFEVIGLNAVSHWRRFMFKEGDQLTWLEAHLQSSDAKRRILLCHAPLLDHAFHRPKQPYLSRNKQLQSILDACGNVIYLSGHTHYSPNCPVGCAEKDQHGNIYVNTGSVCPTLLLSEEALRAEEWSEGNGIALNFFDGCVEVAAFSPKSGKRISRGYYRFDFPC